jgi:uncharacterized protein involved in type VI secretion and phage assembly
MTGVVKENYNEKQPGKILVELYFGEKGKTSTDWVRVMQPYCGKEYGEYFIPEIGTEVVLGFILGNIHKAVVLGCLWNETDKIPADVANKDNSVKSIKTKGGHEIIFDETKDKEKIQINTKGKLTIVLEDKEQKISVKDEKGENLICLDSKNGQIDVKAKKKIVFNAGDKDMLTLDGTGKKASLTADNIEVNATQALTLKGQNAKLEGNMTALKAQGAFKVESSAILELKGAMVKIN